MPKQNNEIIIGVVITIIVFFIIGFFILILVAFINQRKKIHIEEKKTMKSDFQKELLATQLEIQEQTLKNISQEIHDNIGQVLSLAKLNLNTYSKNYAAEIEQKFDDSRKLISKAIQDLRDLSKSLNTDYVVEMGLARSVEYEMEMLRKTGLFDISFHIEGTVIKMESQKELIIFRIAQEILNNIIKHSKASKITTFLAYQGKAFSLEISDNGNGFDPSIMVSNAATGIGIRNMQNRAQLIDADFSINTSPGIGTIARISLPLQK